jgi:3-dehydroquinate synthetase
MLAELGATARLGHTPLAVVERTRALLGRLGLGTHVATAELAASWPFVATDKKRAMNRIKLPVVTGAGEAHVRPVPIEELRAAVLAASG